MRVRIRIARHPTHNCGYYRRLFFTASDPGPYLIEHHVVVDGLAPHSAAAADDHGDVLYVMPAGRPRQHVQRAAGEIVAASQACLEQPVE